MAFALASEQEALRYYFSYICDYHAERMMHDAKVTQTYEGTNQLQRRPISEEILR